MKENEIFDAPPLPQLGRLSGQYMLRVFFAGVGPENKTVYGLAANFVALVDQAAHSYSSAREAMQKFTDSHTAIAWEQVGIACSQYDLCIQSIQRAQAMAKGLSKCRHTPKGLCQCIPHKGDILPKNICKRISAVRNAVQHLENDLLNLEKNLLKGKIGANDAVLLYPNQDSLELGAVSVKYSDLVKAIVLLYPVAESISKYRETD